MTISPPANVKFGPNAPAHVLASGFDTLEAAIDVTWEEKRFFVQLAALEEQAKITRSPVAGELTVEDSAVPSWRFNVQPFGAGGYEWLLQGRHFNLKIGSWRTPMSRPSIMADFRSEGLWNTAPAASVARLEPLLEANGGRIHSCKASRADPAIDILLPEGLWSASLKDHCVTKATCSAA